MNTIKQIGVVECGNPAKVFQLSPLSQFEGYTVSKIYFKNTTPSSHLVKHHPEATIVSDHLDIMNDASIDMVIVSSPSSDEMNIVGEMLRANKATRII